MQQTIKQIAEEIEAKVDEMKAAGHAAFTIERHEEFVTFLQQKEAQVNAMPVAPHEKAVLGAMVIYFREDLNQRRQRSLSCVLESNLKL